MACPKTINLTSTNLTKEKCVENMLFWKARYPKWTQDEKFLENLKVSAKVLPSHTFSYEAIKPIFGYDEKKQRFERAKTQFFSARQRLILSGKVDYDPIPDHMSEAIENGHDIFLFAYHGVHHPFHRMRDNPPIKPFGVFMKNDGPTEVFSCVHGSPWDVTAKNKFATQDLRDHNIDKYYLLPDDLRRLKPIQIQQIEDLNNDFWYYFGNPESWNTKGYGKKLFETSGEFRYLNCVLPEHIAAILWPVWVTEQDLVDKNLDLLSAFEGEFPDIKVVKYTSDLYENFVLSLVEASYFTHRFYLKNDSFPKNAETAKIKIKK